MLPCIEDGPGYTNKDGYVRVWNKPRSVGGRLVMRHRIAWETVKGSIPSGYELDHKCKNRRCYEISHLDLITRSEHAIKTNKERYADTISLGITMLNSGYSKSEISRVTGRSIAAINKWIREGKD